MLPNRPQWQQWMLFNAVRSNQEEWSAAMILQEVTLQSVMVSVIAII